MRLTLAYAIAILAVGVCGGAERQWQTGTWTDIGSKRSPWVAGTAAGTRPLSTTRPEMQQVATYVIETSDLRLELQDMAPIGGPGSFDLSVTVGAPVTFALDGKRTAFIRMNDGKEYRLLVTKKTKKKK